MDITTAFKTHCTAFFSGLIFGLGLILSGMTNPAKVIGFLDITGHWDASLVFVMLGAICVSYFCFQWAKKNKASLLGLPIQLPQNKIIDTKLFTGAVLFGIGWGISGFCPGPAIASMTTQFETVWIFLIAMLVGMIIAKKWLN